MHSLCIVMHHAWGGCARSARFRRRFNYVSDSDTACGLMPLSEHALNALLAAMIAQLVNTVSSVNASTLSMMQHAVTSVGA